MYEEFAYHTKLISSGNILETFAYKEKNSFVRRNSGALRLGQRSSASLIDRADEFIFRGTNRARLMVRRLLYSNFDVSNRYFITLTFDDENIDFASSSLKHCNSYFANFRKRLARLVPSVKWVCVPETQKRGAFHYHLVSDLPISKLYEKNNFQTKRDLYYNADVSGVSLRELWSGGFVSVSPIEGNIITTANYLGKYMSKSTCGHSGRRFHTTQNLERPKVVYSNRFAGDLERDFPLLGNDGKMVYTKDYQDKAGGTISYSLFVPHAFDLAS